jgi:hypothetical protein
MMNPDLKAAKQSNELIPSKIQDGRQINNGHIFVSIWSCDLSTRMLLMMPSPLDMIGKWFDQQFSL